jgi:CRP/FNR family transcriptional regulator
MGENHNNGNGNFSYRWLHAFPILNGIEPNARDILESAGRIIPKSAGTYVFKEGQPCDNFLLVLHGVVRVYKSSGGGNKVVLHRIKGGEACGLTMSSLLLDRPCLANGIAETDAKIIYIPKHHFRRAFSESKSFSKLVFSSLDQNVSDIVDLLGHTVHARLDKRLIAKLLSMRDADDFVRATHDDIANELGTAREVISRLLKDLEKNGLIKLHRGRISIIDAHKLKSTL